MPQQRHNAPHFSVTPAWLRVSVIALAVLVLCSCKSSAPSYRVAQSFGPDGTVHKTATEIDSPTGTPTVKQTIRGQSPEQQAAFLPTATEVMDGGPPPMYGPGGSCCPPGCESGLCCNNCPAQGPDDEYLCDGGDMHSPAAVVTGGSVVGLEQEDAVAHYDSIDGRTFITPSNKVCIYAPRFAAVRQVVDTRGLARIDAPHGEIAKVGPDRLRDAEKAAPVLAEIEPNIHRVRTPPSLLRERQHPGELARDRRVAETLGAVAPYANLSIIRTGVYSNVERVKIARASLAAITWAGVEAAQVVLDSKQAHAEVGEQTPGTTYLLVEPNNPKLRLIKCASTDNALPGEEVEFTLRFDNVGDKVIGNVTILDSLTTRLEYIEGTQKCSMDADFDSRMNEGESLKLRWQIKEPVEKGHGGVIQFRCRVR